jgi:hypothetical protein
MDEVAGNEVAESVSVSTGDAGGLLSSSDFCSVFEEVAGKEASVSLFRIISLFDVSGVV